jgi:hypothetical protein
VDLAVAVGQVPPEGRPRPPGPRAGPHLPDADRTNDVHRPRRTGRAMSISHLAHSPVMANVHSFLIVSLAGRLRCEALRGRPVGLRPEAHGRAQATRDGVAAGLQFLPEAVPTGK